MKAYFKTDKTERINRIGSSIKRIIDNWEKFVIIEDPESGYFIQFAFLKDVYKILMDIPLIELSDELISDLKRILHTDLAVDSVTGEPVSIQKTFTQHEVKRVSKLADEIFTDVFCLTKDYNLLIEIIS